MFIVPGQDHGGMWGQKVEAMVGRCLEHTKDELRHYDNYSERCITEGGVPR